MFRHTTTIGVRRQVCQRYVLERQCREEQTPYGRIRQKISTGYGVTKSKYEYEDLSRIAREKNISIAEILNSLK